MKEYVDKFYDWLKGGSVAPWILIVLSFWWAWPLGIFFTLMKLDVIDPRKWFKTGINTPKRSGVSSAVQGSAELRKDKYKIVSQGMSSVSIDYLAKVVGVDFATAVRDVQEMVIEGAFGPEAYIDYEKRWLMKTSVAVQGEAAPSGASAQSAGTSAGSASGAKSQAAKPAQSAKTASAAAKTRSKFDIYGKQTALLVVGIILCAIGGLAGISTLEDLISFGWMSSLFDVVFPFAMIAAGGSMLGMRFFRKKRMRRFANYMPVIGTRSSVPLSELASSAGVSEATVRKDLEIMLDKKLLPETAYLDVGAGRLVMFHDEEEEVEEEEPKTRYEAIISEIRQLNNDIADEAVSKKIDEIEALTTKIFSVVEDKPEKLPEIKSFMSYYLPTTLKLLRSYSDFERQGVSGQNIDATKERIEKILDTLVSGFSQQLDQLFQADAMDISSDIDVLETMMQKDGLSKDESGFQVGQAGV